MTLAPLLAFVLAACGGGGTTEAAREQDATPSPTARDVREYCGYVAAIETAQPSVDFAALTPEQRTEEAKRFARETLRPLTERILATAPPEVRDEHQILSRAVGEVETTGDFEAVLERPEVKQANVSAHAYDRDHCEWKRVDVSAKDYTFEGVSPNLEVGVVTFEFTNSGTEHHEMVIFRRNDGTTESFDEILALPEGQTTGKAAFFTATDAQPGQEGAYTLANLTPGHYAIICFLPVGSTPEAERATAAGGPPIAGEPHWRRGMKTEFTVQ